MRDRAGEPCESAALAMHAVRIDDDLRKDVGMQIMCEENGEGMTGCGAGAQDAGKEKGHAE
jgi:hypothetical protein